MPSPPDAAERAAVEEFCRAHFALAQRIARKWARWFPSLDIDLESDAMLALWKAARTRATWPGKAESLVHLHCHAACMRLICRERRRPDSQVSTGQPAEGPPLVEAVADATPPAALYAELADLLNQLPAKRRERIVRRFLDGDAYTALGAEDGITGEGVAMMIGRDFAKLRTLAGEE